MNDYMVTEFGGICTGIDKPSLVDYYECVRASKSLNKFFYLQDEQANYPRGCYLLSNDYVYWNNHKTGRKNLNSAAICRKSSNNL